MTVPVVLSRPLALSPLARLAGEEAGAAWFARRPRSPDAWSGAAAHVQRGFAGRDWLTPLAPALATGTPASERLHRVAREGGVLVTTGQQPGLFGGPIYTWSKALSALALADHLEAATGVPVAPVFWAATYDADFAEASATHVAVGPVVERIAMAPDAPPGLPMSDLPLGDVHAALDALEQGSGAMADAATFAMLREAYGTGQTVGTAFVALLRAVLEPLGIAVLDAGAAAVRTAAQPFLERALRAALDVDQAVQAREAELRASGFRPQVPYVKGLSLVFARRDGVRTRIPLGAVRDAHAELDPNVLLRPVLERALLPTVAYLGGPGEMAYFAQSSAAADALAVARPLVLPRWSGLVVEPHVRRVLERHGLEPDEVRDADAALARLVRSTLPAALGAALARLRSDMDRALDAVTLAVEGDPPTLVSPEVLEGARRAILHRADRLERRIVAAAKRRAGAVARDVGVAHAALFPLGRPQERVLNLMPLLARHGRALLAAMLEQARAHADVLVAGAEPPAGALLHGHAGNAR